MSERSQYDSYGNVQFYTAGWATATSSAANNPILYAGYTFDSENGMYLARNRLLNVGLAIWSTRDGLEYYASANLYQYCQSSPLTLVDASGFAPEEIDLQLTKVVPKDCPKCPCAEPNNDCKIDVRFYPDLTTLNLTITVPNPRGGTIDLPQKPIKPHHFAFFLADQQRYAGDVEVAALITLKSETRNVRNCHLHQEAGKWIQNINGAVMANYWNKDDYSVYKPKTSSNNPVYGGWWIFDSPSQFSKQGDPKAQFAKVAFRAFVYVEENPKISIWWGFNASLDYRRESAQLNTWGPAAREAPNPYLPKR